MASAVAWAAVTNAPWVTEDSLIRPEIGATTLVKPRLISAACKLALALAASAWACTSAMRASSRSLWETLAPSFT